MRALGFRSLRVVVAVAVMTIVAAACARSQPGSSALDEVGLQPGSVVSLDRVDLIGVPRDIDPSNLMVWLKAGDAEVPIPILLDQSGPYILAPLNPSDPHNGGTIELVLEHSGERSPTLELSVDPLPATPGAWDDTVDVLRNAIAQRAEAGGMTFAQLQATAFEDIAPEHQPLKFAQEYLDNGTENDLESLLTTALNDFSDDDRAMIDALMGRLDLATLVGGGASISGFRGWNEDVALSSLLASAAGSGGSGGGCRAAGIEVVDAQDLSDKMKFAIDSVIVDGGAEQQVLEDIGSATFWGGFIPVVGPWIGAVGAMFTAIEAFKNGVAGLYPSSFVDMRAQVTRDDFAEDFQAPGGFSDIKVTARSDGWDADADVAATILAVASTGGSFTSDIVDASLVEGFAVDVIQSLRDSAGNSIVEQYADFLTYCPETWEIDITDEPWSKVEAQLERFEIDRDQRTFEPIEQGLQPLIEDTLVIEVNADEFGGRRWKLELPLRVHAIDVDGQDVIYLSPDQLGVPIDVPVTIDLAVDPTLEWTTAKGAWTGTPSVTNTGTASDPDLPGSVTWTRQHVSPSSPSEFPYSASIFSDSTSGLRADGTPPRVHQIEFMLANLFITPDPGAVFVERDLEFKAVDADGVVQPVIWSATGGTIEGFELGEGVVTGTAIYYAGSEPGTYTVTAQHANNPGVSATVAVEVIDSTCLLGTWRVREQDFLDQVSSFGPVTIEQESGTWTVDFQLGLEEGAAMGPYVEVFDALTFRAETEAGDFVIELRGKREGEWQLLEGGTELRITITNDVVEQRNKIVQGGVERNLPGFGLGNMPALGFGATVGGDDQVPFTCSGSVLSSTEADAQGSITVTLDKQS